MARERLRPADAALLHLETPVAPLHVGWVGLFEAAPLLDGAGCFRLEDVRRLVAARLDRAPHLRQRPVEVPFGMARPAWVDDPRFDLAYHVRLTAVPRPGGDAELASLVARLQTSPLDRSRPLWELWFVEGLTGGQVAVVQKVHPAVADWGDGVPFAGLLDAEARSEPPPAPTWRPRPSPGPGQLLARAAVDGALAPVQLARSVWGGSTATSWGTWAADAGRELSRVLPRAGRPEPRPLPFNGPLGSARRYAAARADLDRLRAVATRQGTSIAAAVLAVVAGALRAFLQRRGTDVRSPIRALVPLPGVAQLPAVVIDLPVHEADAPARLALVTEELVGARRLLPPTAPGLLGALAELAPPALLGLTARLLPFSTPVHVVVGWWGGPVEPRYLLGGRLQEAFPYLGIAGRVGLAVGATWVGDRVGFGLTGERDLLPDLDDLAADVDEAAAELAAAGGP